MLSDELKEQLKSISPDIEIIKQSWDQSQFESEFQSLEQQTIQEDFWKRTDQTEILKLLQHIKNLRQQYIFVTSNYQDLNELIDLFSHDEQELSKIKIEVGQLVKKALALKVQLLLHEPQDQSNCFISINAGAGGTESQDWADMLLRMYVRFCEQQKLKADLLDYQPGEAAGIKSATLYIQGPHAFGLLKSEHGIHRLVRISPYDANKRRHTSFAAAFITPELPEENISIDQKDLRIDTYRAGGAGGQHVNKTDSAVRITHIPTGIVVQCQSERSQTQNKETAMKMLYAKLAQKAQEEQEAKIAGIEKKSIEWGSQIRSYVLHPYKMVKDHRTDHESPQPELVLNGDLMPFIESYLVSKTK
ncbi:MAG TPA: peptide chain release factor 2 [Candidatus Babeliales bacterium]|nr:peptide chain release factor 2 [Candidatus Babeliales bacterium]